MLKKIWPSIAKTRVAVILSSVFCALSMYGQLSLPERLTEILINNDWDKGFQLYNQITDSEIKQLSDSYLFDYHYLGALLNSDTYMETPNHEKTIYHLKEAKKLCDSSLGTYFIGYMEIMDGLGTEYAEQGKFEEALAVYEEGLVKSMNIRDKAPQNFANLLMGIQECQENLGLFTNIPTLLMDPWEFWDKDMPSLDYISYWPLWCLEQFYFKYEYYKEGLNVNEEIINFINEKGGSNHPEEAHMLYFKGSIFSNLKNYTEAIGSYKRGISILSSNDRLDDSVYGMLLGNLLNALIDNDQSDECFDLLDEIKDYSSKRKDPDLYKNNLFTIINKLNEKCKYDIAMTLNSQLKDLSLTDAEKGVIERQTNEIIYNKEVSENYQRLKINFESFDKNSEEWFDAGHKFASACFITKELDKANDVLEQMHAAIQYNSNIGQDYYYWILNNLYNLSWEKGDYENALNYALENFKLVSSVENVPEKIRYSSLNNLIVAKLRSAKIEGIDAYLDEYRDLCIGYFGENSTDYGIYLHNRGRAYHLQGKLDEAKQYYLMANRINIQNVGKANKTTVQYLMEVNKQIVEQELDL